MELSYGQAVALLDRAVNEYGRSHAISPSTCLYFDPDGKPYCLIGVVLSYLGITRDQLSGNAVGLARRYIPLNGMTICQRKIEDDASVRYSTVLNHLGITADERTLRLFHVAQSDQDEGQAWGPSVEHAREVTRV